ncbi:hypothetical protein J4429_02125 [Candidatus Pacearchaeota archaeon]|nr:hypothetical protein [Candidatus Pacearchaeota archaeon]
MVKFFIFNNDNDLKEFFNEIKKSSNIKWKYISKITGISKTTLERYRSNSSRIREDNFYKLLKLIPIEYKNKLTNNVSIIDSKTWLSRGGKEAFKINSKKFEEGRKKGIIALKHYKNNKKTSIPKINFDLSKKICEFIGAFIGDGMFNLYNNKLYHIEFSGDSEKDLEYYKNEIIPTIQSVIPSIKHHIYKVKQKNCIRIVFYSKDLFYFLKEGFGFVPGKKTFTTSIPDKIMNSREELIDATIRGIFDTDGCIFLDKRKNYKNPYPRISLQIASKPLYEQLKHYLSKEFKIYTAEPKDRNIYYIEIYGISQLNKWMSKIGFSNKRHLNKIATVA